MAFSKAPSESTRQTKDVKLLWSLDNRESSTNKDSIAKNGFFDLIKSPATKDDTYTFHKREGIQSYLGAIASTNIRGTHYWEDQDKLYVAYDSSVAIFTGSTGVLQTTITPFTTTSGDVVFTDFYYDDGSTKIVVGDGIRLWTFDSTNTAVQTTAPDFPTPFKPSILFLDGYLFLVKEGTSDIYNSNLNDPLLWTAGDFITAEMIPDTLFRIARLSNYLVAMGSASIEYFFDAGNASGSPLQRNDTPVKHIGYLGAFATYENKIFFVGQSTATAPLVYVLEDFKMDLVENPVVMRQLQKGNTYKGTIVSMGGHVFYVLSTDTLTYALDLDTKVWTRLGYRSTDRLPATNGVVVPISGDGYCSVFSLAGSSNLYYFKPGNYLDNGETFSVVCQIPKQRFDSMREKYMSRIILTADKTTGTLLVDWSDNDYQTYSTPREIDLSLEKPMLHRLGRFVERSLRFTLNSASSFRMVSVEVDYNLGLK